MSWYTSACRNGRNVSGLLVIRSTAFASLIFFHIEEGEAVSHVICFVFCVGGLRIHFIFQVVIFALVGYAFTLPFQEVQQICTCLIDGGDRNFGNKGQRMPKCTSPHRGTVFQVFR